jgi:hypothetical protein
MASSFDLLMNLINFLTILADLSTILADLSTILTDLSTIFTDLSTIYNFTKISECLGLVPPLLNLQKPHFFNFLIALRLIKFYRNQSFGFWRFSGNLLGILTFFLIGFLLSLNPGKGVGEFLGK